MKPGVIARRWAGIKTVEQLLETARASGRHDFEETNPRGDPNFRQFSVRHKAATRVFGVVKEQLENIEVSLHVPLPKSFSLVSFGALKIFLPSFPRDMEPETVGPTLTMSNPAFFRLTIALPWDISLEQEILLPRFFFDIQPLEKDRWGIGLRSPVLNDTYRKNPLLQNDLERSLQVVEEEELLPSLGALFFMEDKLKERLLQEELLRSMKLDSVSLVNKKAEGSIKEFGEQLETAGFRVTLSPKLIYATKEHLGFEVAFAWGYQVKNNGGVLLRKFILKEFPEEAKVPLLRGEILGFTPGRRDYPQSFKKLPEEAQPLVLDFYQALLVANQGPDGGG